MNRLFLILILSVATIGKLEFKGEPEKIMADQPVAIACSVSGTEDTDYAFKVNTDPRTGDFKYTDNDYPSDDLVQVVIEVLPGNGTLYLDNNPTNGTINAGETIVIGTNNTITKANIPLLKFKPNANFNGSTTLQFELRSGGNNTNDNAIMTINIAAVNDAPTCTLSQSVTILEDATKVFASTDFPGYSDVETTPLAEIEITVLPLVGTFFYDTNASGGYNIGEDVSLNQKIAATDLGKLMFTPVANANGAAYATFSFKVSDGSAYSAASSVMTINVTSVNDLPTSADKTFNNLPDNANKVFAASDFAYTDVETANLTHIRLSSVPAGARGTLWVDTDGNGSVNGGEAALAAAGTVTYADLSKLKFKPIPDATGANFTTTFVFDVNDGSGVTGYSASTYTFTLNVVHVNLAPSFTKGGNQTVLEDFGLKTVPGWANPASISAGTNESSQTVSFVLTNNNNALFSVQPAVAANGDLTFTTAANANGSATVTIYIKDNGGTALGGVDQSASQTFTIDITAVNDAPVVSPQTFSIAENSNNGTIVGTIVASDIEGDALSYTFAAPAPTAFALNPLTGVLTVADKNQLNYETTTVFTFDVEVTDIGLLTTTKTMTVNITNVNDIPPVIATPVTLSVTEGVANGTVVGTIPVSDAPENDSYTFTINGGNIGGAFAINDATHEVYIANTLAVDFETLNTYTLNITVSDGTNTDTENITVNILDGVDPPKFTSTPVLYAKVGAPSPAYTYTAVADRGTLSCLTKPAWLNFNPATGVLSGDPTGADVGYNSVVLQSDDAGVITKQTFDIFVTTSVITINPPASIQATINLGTTTNGALLLLGNGTFNQNIDFKGKNIVIMGNSYNASQVILSGTGGSVVNFNTGESSMASLKYVTIKNGTGTLTQPAGTGNPNSRYGGGVYIGNASPSMEYVIIESNSTAAVSNMGGSGGGIYIAQGGALTLKNSFVRNNSAQGFMGAGICVYGGTLTISDVTITGNSGTSYGGAICAWNSTLTLTNVTISSNAAGYLNGIGGGIFGLKSNITVTGTGINSNTATKTGNGLYLIGCTVTGSFLGGDSKIILP